MERRPLAELAAAGATVLAWAAVKQAGLPLWLGLLVGGCWAAYFAIRLVRRPAHWQEWGLGATNLRPAFLAAMVVVVFDSAAIAVWVFIRGDQGPVGVRGWTLALYPVWAFVQEFALQNVVVAGLSALRVPAPAVALVGGLALGASHLPEVGLALAAGAGGVVFVGLWLAYRNLWAVAFCHAFLGCATLVFVLRSDPLAGMIP